MVKISLLNLKGRPLDVLDRYSVPFSAGLITTMLLQTCFGMQTLNSLISGSSSVITALIAYEALAVGRDYVGKMMTEEGYRKAIILKDEVMPKFFLERYSQFYLSSALGMVNILMKVEKSDVETQLCIKTLFQYSRELHKHADNIEGICAEFQRLITSTKTHELTLSQDYISDFFGTEGVASDIASKIQDVAGRIEMIIEPYFKPMSDKQELNNLRDGYINIIWCEEDVEIINLVKCIKDAVTCVGKMENHRMNYERLKYASIKKIFQPD